MWVDSRGRDNGPPGVGLGALRNGMARVTRPLCLLPAPGEAFHCTHHRRVRGPAPGIGGQSAASGGLGHQSRGCTLPLAPILSPPPPPPQPVCIDGLLALTLFLTGCVCVGGGGSRAEALGTGWAMCFFCSPLSSPLWCGGQIGADFPATCERVAALLSRVLSAPSVPAGAVSRPSCLPPCCFPPPPLPVFVAWWCWWRGCLPVHIGAPSLPVLPLFTPWDPLGFPLLGFLVEMQRCKQRPTMWRRLAWGCSRLADWSGWPRSRLGPR